MRYFLSNAAALLNPPHPSFPSDELLDEVQSWYEKLNVLSVTEIRELLRTEEVVGLPFVARRCPIANLIRKKTGAEISVCARNSSINVSFDDYDQREFEHSTSLGQFVRQFDKGDFPELLAKVCNCELEA